MRLSTRLILPLLLVVVGVMSLYMAWSLDQRQRTLETEGLRATRAYATALGVALKGAFRDRLGENTHMKPTELLLPMLAPVAVGACSKKPRPISAPPAAVGRDAV